MRAESLSLFATTEARSSREILGPGALLLHGLAAPKAEALWRAVGEVQSVAPFRRLVTPGGLRMSVAMTNCGAYGWVSDARGYRYAANDPESERPWPAMPEVFLELSELACNLGGFEGFVPDSCLINRYEPGTKLSLHQDKDEASFEHPIVSVSLGLPATFLFGGMKRSDKVQRVAIEHGDVVIWGGTDRLRFHGVAPIKAGHHPLLGEQRVNLTLRRAR